MSEPTACASRAAARRDVCDLAAPRPMIRVAEPRRSRSSLFARPSACVGGAVRGVAGCLLPRARRRARAHRDPAVAIPWVRPRRPSNEARRRVLLDAAHRGRAAVGAVVALTGVGGSVRAGTAGSSSGSAAWLSSGSTSDRPISSVAEDPDALRFCHAVRADHPLAPPSDVPALGVVAAFLCDRSARVCAVRGAPLAVRRAPLGACGRVGAGAAVGARRRVSGVLRGLIAEAGAVRRTAITSISPALAGAVLGSSSS